MPRQNKLDQLRALAICLMIFQHISLYFNFYPDFAYVISRPAYPLFMIISGYLMAQFKVSWLRVLEVAIVGLICELFRYQTGFNVGGLNILLVWVLSVLTLKLLEDQLGFAVFIVACVLVVLPDPTASVMEFGIAKTLFLLVIGKHFGSVIFDNMSNVKRDIFSKLGQYPLTAYAGHFACLAFIQIITT